MIDLKKNGAYYTPKILTDFLVKHLKKKYLEIFNDFNVLEPSCGDGAFVNSLMKHISSEPFNLDLVELNKDELEKAVAIIPIKNQHKSYAYNANFLDITINKYSLIIGNPPYINKKFLSKEQIQKCNTICKEAIPDLGEIKNIWPSFLLKSINHLKDDGILCLVLPSELLQVKYTKKIRDYLLLKFERIEVFAFNELIFPGIEQDIIVFVGIKKCKNELEKGVTFYQVNKLEDLKIPDYTEKYFNVHRKNLDKWTNYILNDSDLNFIGDTVDKLKLNKLNYYCDKLEVGIVTAANDFFILTSSDVEKNNLNDYIKPILHKGAYVNDTFYFTKSDFEQLDKKNKRVNLILLPNKPKSELDEMLIKYIHKGEENEIPKGHKMKKRVNWYSVPSIWYSQAFFTKRSHLYPKIIINNANVLSTDSLYRIMAKKLFDINNIAFSFFNSLTLVLAELNGRFYGGGVLELTPNELKNLHIPYNEISLDHKKKIDSLFRERKSIEVILNFSNKINLNKLNSHEINRLENIRNQLICRRLKCNGTPPVPESL